MRERERNEFLSKKTENENGTAMREGTGVQVVSAAEVVGGKEEKKAPVVAEKGKMVREYVDQSLTREVDIGVTNLVFGLRKQYARQKIEKPGKKIPKNYVFGIKEVLKHLEAKYWMIKNNKPQRRNVKALIAAPNIERIECEGGIDSFLEKIFRMCRDQKLPIIFCLSMGKLGLIAKSQGTKIALLAVIRYIGNEDLFKAAVETADVARKQFYEANVSRVEELRANRFLVGSPYLAPAAQVPT